jgi:hypothetical protein
MALSRLLEMVSLSYFKACKRFGMCSSKMQISSEIGLSEPPEIIEKWMKARMF